jgi:(p)ppGpp synthase/HD superfamily hydrolase
VAYSKRFDDALLYAVDVHRDQVRKGSSIPYVTHLLGVASIVGESGGSEDEVIAALLHDAIEDTDATYTTLADRFDKPVAEIVRACSDTDVTPKPAWEKRKKDYIAHVVGASESVRLVSAADKLANARSVLADLRVLGDELWSTAAVIIVEPPHGSRNARRMPSHPPRSPRRSPHRSPRRELRARAPRPCE